MLSITKTMGFSSSRLDMSSNLGYVVQLSLSLESNSALIAGDRIWNLESSRIHFSIGSPYTNVYVSADTCKVDLCFVLDSSASVNFGNQSNWNTTLSFVNSIIARLDVSRAQVQVALVVFSNDSRVVFKLNEYNTVAELQAAVNAAPFINQRSNLYSALVQLRGEVQHHLFSVWSKATLAPKLIRT